MPKKTSPKKVPAVKPVHRRKPSELRPAIITLLTPDEELLRSMDIKPIQAIAVTKPEHAQLLWRWLFAVLPLIETAHPILKADDPEPAW
jgi:hypothetical protein